MKRANLALTPATSKVAALARDRNTITTTTTKG
jgi:hypothetical protein